MTPSEQSNTPPVDQPAAANTAPASEPASAAASTTTPEELVAAAKKEAADNYNRYLRAVADLENYRKRVLREKDELRQFAAARVLEDLIPVLDNLALGLAAAKQAGAELKNLVGGVEMVMAQMKTVLGNHGLKEIDPAGQLFDPHKHEAISHQPSDEVPEEHIMAVVRAGYTLNGRLLRPANVVVSSGAAKKA